MSYSAEFKGTLCSSSVSGGSKSFAIQPSPTGYYMYNVTITTYKCAYASCIGGYAYRIHVYIRNAATGEIAYAATWEAPFNPKQRTTITISSNINLQPNTSYTMTWWTDPVDFAGGCVGFQCIVCADIDMVLLSPVPSPTPTPTPTPSPPPIIPPPVPSLPPITIPWWIWGLVGAAIGAGMGLLIIEGVKRA